MLLLLVKKLRNHFLILNKFEQSNYRLGAVGLPAFIRQWEWLFLMKIKVL